MKNGATSFQEKVYTVVAHIPKGQTRSYAWVARQIGQPRAVRAVGQALKRNPDPKRVPCHRVIRSDGSLGGYAWSVSRKRKLLAGEGAQVGLKA